MNWISTITKQLNLYNEQSCFLGGIGHWITLRSLWEIKVLHYIHFSLVVQVEYCAMRHRSRQNRANTCVIFTDRRQSSYLIGPDNKPNCNERTTLRVACGLHFLIEAGHVINRLITARQTVIVIRKDPVSP